MKSIKFIVEPDGSKVEIDAEGFEGDSCTKITEQVQKALGSAIKTKLKPEFYINSEVGVSVNA